MALFQTIGLWALGAALTAPVPAIEPLPDSVSSLQMRELSPPEEAVPRLPVEPVPAPLLTPRPHYALALLETSVAIAAGTVWYWRAAQFNSRDWDLHWDWPSWRRKLTFDAPRFDDNQFDTNALWHPLDGAGLYLLARGNRLPALQSLALVAASSVVWEYAVEFREYPSVNDMIFTPMAAVAIAEPAVRVAALLRAGNGGRIARSVAAVLDPVGAANRHFESGAQEDLATDAWGLPREFRHRLELTMGFGRTDFGAGRQRSQGELGLDLFVDSARGFGRPGRSSGVAGPGTLTFLSGSAAVDDGRLVGAGVAGKVAMVGARWRHFDESLDRKPRGHVLFVGLASGFEYLKRATPTFDEDTVANVRVLGPMVDWALARGRFGLHAEGDASYDFAMVHPLAGDASLATSTLSDLPTVVTRERYYYAQGLSLRTRLLATLGRWESGLDLEEDTFEQVDVLDRNDAGGVPGTADRRARRRLWLGVRPWSSLPLKATVAGDQLIRVGHMNATEVRASEMRASTALGLVF